VNVIVNADGSTNIPSPKVKTSSSPDSTLNTIVDLAVGEFHIHSGLLVYSQKKQSFNIRGENLRSVLQYDGSKQLYAGYIHIEPLKLSYGNEPPLLMQIDLPLELQKNKVSVTNAHLSTPLSRILFSASAVNLRNPEIALKMSAQLSPSELAGTFGVPVDARGPQVLYADIDGKFNGQAKTITLPRFHMVLGKTTFDASGQGQAIGFNANLAVGEMSRLFKLSSLELTGDLELRGTANADMVDGTINSRGLTLREGSTYLSNVSISTPFHATSQAVRLDQIKVRVLGGTLSASIVVEELRKVAVKADLRGFSIPALAVGLTGRSIGYDGTVEGAVSANADLSAKGTSGIIARTLLRLTPGSHNVPLKGEISAAYSGGNGQIDVGQSYLALPHSSISFSGIIGKEVKVGISSHNLNDFLPLANFSSTVPLRTLPVTLSPRGLASITARMLGQLERPQITANATITQFQVRGSHFDRFGVDLRASPSTLNVNNGSLSSTGLSAAFDASLGLVKWRPLGRSPVSANVTLNRGGVRELLALAGTDDETARGEVNAVLRIGGTYGNPLGYGNIHTADGEAYGQPFQSLDARLSLSNQLARLDALDVSSAGGTLSATGSFRHPAETMTSGHVDVQLAANSLQLGRVAALQQPNGGVGGVVTLKAIAVADVASGVNIPKVTVLNVDADLSAQSLRVRGQDAGALTASAHTSNGNLMYRVGSNFAGSNIKLEGRTALSAGYVTNASAVIGNLSVGKALELANQGNVPVSGTLSATARLTGPLDSPDLTLDFGLTKAILLQEPVDSLVGTIHYDSRLLDIPSLSVSAPAGKLTLSGKYQHDADSYHGVLSLHVPESEFQVAKIKHAQSVEPGIAGALRLAADISAAVSDKNHSPQVLVTSISADVSAKGLRTANGSLGGFTLSAHTANSNVKFQLDSDLAQSQIHASGESQLAANYPTRAQATFKSVRYENIAPLLDTASAAPPLFNALVEGQASMSGPLLDASALSARLELNQLQVRTGARPTSTGGPVARTVEFQNLGPIVIALDRSVAKVESLHLRGPQASLDVSGSIQLANDAAPLDLSVNATGDLGVLQNMSRSFYSSGSVAVNAMVRGTFADPLLNGKIELHNANINYAEVPNGISNGNGVILLSGTTATVQNLTAESGGGKIAISGFVGLSPGAVIYNIHARATNVRTRYDQLSVTTTANLALTGSSQRSLLTGLISVQRVAYSSSSDIGSLLYGASAPPASTAEPSSLLANMRLDIHVVTASDVRVVTSYVQKLNLTGNLVVRGTAAEPGITGKIVLTDGQLAFFGNTYDVRTGSISFYDATAIRPILDLSLETVAQGVDVVLGVTGPVSNMKLSYRSDPPLTFDQIVQLLATNTTPFDATIASQQPPEPTQSASQMGESAILGQAVANPLASRVQRVFGLSEFKIDPSIAGSNGQPSARVTLQQKIANNLTFTYITDVTQTNSEIVRVQLDLSAKTSAVALRDYNGNVSIELYHKFQKR
jgi:translocation and assembly module TamB